MPHATDYSAFHDLDDASDAREAARKADFKALPILADFLATMLQDLQYTEMDEACEAEREEADTGTIYTLADDTYEGCKAYCQRFYDANRADIDAALDLEPGSDGLRYTSDYITEERIGSTLYMVAVGHGVSFTDNGNADCLERLNEATRSDRLEFSFDPESETVQMWGG